MKLVADNITAGLDNSFAITDSVVAVVRSSSWLLIAIITDFFYLDIEDLVLQVNRKVLIVSFVDAPGRG